MRLWMLSAVTWLAAGALLVGLVVLDGAKNKMKAPTGVCHRDQTGVSICPNPNQG